MSGLAGDHNIIDAVTREPALTDVIDKVEASPPDQDRLFRVRWRADGSRCILKVGLGDLEAMWMPEMNRRCSDVLPRVRANGASIDGHDKTWLIMDELPHLARSDRFTTARGPRTRPGTRRTPN